MSAFQCSNDHLKLLAIWAERPYPFNGWSIAAADGDFLVAVTRAFQKLYHANQCALRDRYASEVDETSETISCDDVQRLSELHSPVSVIKQALCYEYQACEWVEWRTSDALELSRAAISAAANELPGYESAPWGL